MLQKEFKDYTGYEPETYRRSLLRYLDDLDKLIDERILEYRELRMKESDVKAIKEIENMANLSTNGTSLDASLVTKGTTLDASLVTEGIEMDASLVAKQKDLQGDELLHYDAEIELMNLILLSIPNEIYNSVDACTTAKEMWKRVERLMRGTIQNQVDRETCFTNEFDQFVAKLGEALVSVYNRFAQLMNDLERNKMIFPIVTVNTKFLNSLQLEWLKYVTQVRLAKCLTVD
ncbi:hypothetical protein Tco_0806812 [Tanacetum coccineum]